MELTQNNKVIFNEDKHTYTLVDEQTFETKPLQGVTKMIKTIICPELYKDVNEATLQKAAERGSHLHKLCEMFDNGELIYKDGEFYNEDTLIPDAELKAYIKLIKDYEIMPIASEYLVSDNENFASCIDKVASIDKKNVAIIDLKFTYTFNEEPVMWQTSIYADWFEHQNPGIKVKKLYCIHIHQYKDHLTADLHELTRVPSEYIEQLMACYLMHQAGVEVQFVNPMKKKDATLDWAVEREQQIIEVSKQIKELEKVKSDAMNEIKAMFADNPDTKKYVGQLLTFSCSLTKHQLVFDEDRFRAENPELYRKYMTKDRVTAGRTTLSINK